MAEKDKSKATIQPPKNIPKDGQVIMAVMKEMGIHEYDSKCLVQLTEFVYRYSTCTLEDSRNFAHNCKKKYLDIEDIKLALDLSNESSFVQPPPREVLLECARNKNNIPLPLVKSHCGLRLPPDRYCLSTSNFVLKFPVKKPKAMSGSTPSLKIAAKQNLSYIKRINPSPILKQAVTIPKAFINVQNPTQTILKPKIQIQQGQGSSSINMQPTEIEEMGGLKRKREEDDVDM